MMRNQFSEQLNTLNTELIRMGALCEEAIATAAKALLERDTGLTEKVFSIDRHIDQTERDIEALCIKLLLQQQPVAGDLRLISAAMKMISDMERIGDQASDIAEISRFIDSGAGELPLGEMASAAIRMVTDSVSSFVGRDLELARNVIKSDDAVDEFFSRIKKELIGVISASPEQGEFSLDMLMIAKYLERIGDHATNIAEWVEFSLTGLYKGKPL